MLSASLSIQGGAVSCYHAGDDSKFHALSSPFSSAKTDRTESCLFLFLSFLRRLELLTSCSMLDDLPLALRYALFDSGCCGRSEVGVSSCCAGEDQASEVLRLGVVLRLGKTRPRKPFFRSWSRRFARVVPGPARGDDLCSTSSISKDSCDSICRGGYDNVVMHSVFCRFRDYCMLEKTP